MRSASLSSREFPGEGIGLARCLALSGNPSLAHWKPCLVSRRDRNGALDQLAGQDWKARSSARSRTWSQAGHWSKELDRVDATMSVGGVFKPGVRHVTHGTPEEGRGDGDVVAFGSVGSSLEVSEVSPGV